MFKRPMPALFAASVFGIVCAGRGWGCVVTGLFFYFLFLISFLIVSEKTGRFENRICLPAWYGRFWFFILSVPVVFVLFFVKARAYAGRIGAESEAYECLYEMCEDECIVSGTVASVNSGDGRTKIMLRECTVKGYYENVERKGGGCIIHSDGTDPGAIRIGDTLRAYGSFYAFTKARNPGGFDSFEYYSEQGVYASVYAKKVWISKADGYSVADGMKEVMRKGRDILKRGLRESFSEEDASVLTAMLTGDRDDLPDETGDLYGKTGISHILAVSGLHISLICLGFFRLLTKLTCPAKLSYLLTALFTMFFAIFTGARPSVLRASFMTLVLLLSYTVRRHYDMLSAAAFAGIIILFNKPSLIRSSSFLLSFCAVLGLYAAKESGKTVFSAAIVTLVTLPVTLSFYYEFSPYSILTNVLIMPVTSALLTFGMLSGILGIISPLFGTFFGGVAFFCLRWLEISAKFVNSLPYSYVLSGKPGRAETVFYVFSCVLVYMTYQNREKIGRAVVSFCSRHAYVPFKVTAFLSAPAGKKKHYDYGSVKRKKLLASFLEKITGRKEYRYEEEESRFSKMRCVFCLRLISFSVFALSYAFLITPGKPKDDRMTLLDVGQGDCAVFQSTENDTILFDCGSSDQSSVSKYVLVPFLKHEGIALLDLVTVSHTDSDHMNGVSELLEAMDRYEGDAEYRRDYEGNPGVKKLILQKVKEPDAEMKKLIVLAKEKNVCVEFIEAGGEIELESDSAECICLWPLKADKSENGTSLVFRLSSPKTVYYMMGDADIEAEKKMAGGTIMGSFETEDKKVVLKVGHHGSYTATSEEWLELVSPTEAVISCGHGNPYGHPHADVIQRLKKAGVRYVRTDEAGACTVN